FTNERNIRPNQCSEPRVTRLFPHPSYAPGPPGDDLTVVCTITSAIGRSADGRQPDLPHGEGESVVAAAAASGVDAGGRPCLERYSCSVHCSSFSAASPT